MLKMKALRLVAGLTQKEVCEAIGVSKPTLIKWENGLVTPKEEDLQRLADYYDCKPRALLKDNAKVR